MPKKTLKGWRTKYDWDKPTGVKHIDVAIERDTSDDGWVCPYCKTKETLEGSEISNDDYLNLMQNSCHEPVRIFCTQCDKEYFCMASVVIKYQTCKEAYFD